MPREDHVARRDASAYAVAPDAMGRLDRGARNDITGDHVLVDLTEAVPDAPLRRLRAVGRSYLFAGAVTVDFARAVEKLGRLFGIARLLVEGGGGIDGLRGTPAAFGIDGEETESLGARRRLDLQSSETPSGGVVWMRYRIAAV